MKTITKRSLDELAKEMPVIEETEMRQVIGGDRFVFDENGELLKRIKDTNNYFVVGSQEISLGDDLSSPCYGGTGANFEGGALTKEVFEFMAKNTNVEWALSLNDSGTKGYLVTSNLTHHVNEDDAFKTGYTQFYHSHGNIDLEGAPQKYKELYSYPSEADVDAISRAKLKGYESFNIYNKQGQGGYKEYNSSSMTQQEFANDNDIEIENPYY